MAEKLAIAVIHFHLRPGGVTRVIERAVESLGNRADILVLSGEAPAANDALVPLSEPFDALAYSDAPLFENARQRAEDLRFTAKSLLGKAPDVWHIHNHALGKNSFTPFFVRHLAEAGCRVLLQPHDFAEDGRPENYRLLNRTYGDTLNKTLYPTGDHIWYAPINYRDKSFLETIGIPNVHALPNAVTAHEIRNEPEPSTQKTIVYPARAIRRKNIGEFLLWSLLAPEGYRFQSTLAPQNPTWKTFYDGWVAFAEELKLPVEFDAGRKHDFTKLVQNAEALISTSIAEGFGLAFLEPWLEGKPLIGRKLPEITTDFEQENLDLSSLYSALPVPIEWIGEAVFLETLEAAMRKSYAAYDREWNNGILDEAEAKLIVDGKIDFGILDEAMQQTVIRHLAKHPADRAQLPSFPTPQSPDTIAHNHNIAGRHYSLDAYGERLAGLYRDLTATQPGPVSYADPAALLDQFLKPERFNLLRA